MASSSSSSTHPHPNRRQPTSFLGGPFLVNQLHQLPLSVVDLIFTFPSTNPSFNHSDLVTKGLKAIIFAADVISKEKFPDWSPSMRKAVVDQTLRHSCLRKLAFDWALDERARDQGSFDEDKERLEFLFLAIAGGLQTERGDQEAVQWLRVVLEETFDQSAKKIEEKVKSRMAEASREPTPIHLSPPTPLIPLQPQPVEEPPPVLQPPPPPEPTTTFSLVRDAIKSLPAHELNSIFTHPSINPTDNLDQLVPSGLAFLRSVVHTIILRNVSVRLDPDRIELLIDASVSPETIIPLAKGWRLDWNGRARGAPEAFLDSRTDQLFFSLVGGMKRSLGEDRTGGWLIGVMGECVREKFEELGAGGGEGGEDASMVDVEMSEESSSERLLSIVKQLTSTSNDILITAPESLAPAGREFGERTLKKLAASCFASEQPKLRNEIVQAAMKTTSLQDLAVSLELPPLHAQFAGPVSRHPAAQSLVLLALFRAVEMDCSTEDATFFIRAVMLPTLVKIAAPRIGGGRSQPVSEDVAEIEDPSPLPPPLFEHPSVGPKVLQTIFSWISPITLNRVLSHPSVNRNDNFTFLLVEGGTAVSFLSAALILLSRVWYPEMTDLERGQIITRVLGAEQLSSLAMALGLSERIRTQVPIQPAHLRDVLVALVEGGAKDLGFEGTLRWIDTAFRSLFDRVMADKPAPPSNPNSNPLSSHPLPTGRPTFSIRTQIQSIAHSRNEQFT